MQKKTYIAICTPSGEDIKADTAMALAIAIVTGAGNGINLTILNPRDSIVARARNDIVDHALKIGVDYLLWLDSDMIFPPDIVQRLLNHRKLIVGCLYSQRIPPYGVVGELTKPSAKSGLQEATKLGGGCLLVDAKVYKDMPFPWYFDVFRWDGTPIQSFKRQWLDTSMIQPPPEVIENVINIPGMKEWIEKNHAEMIHSMIGEDYAFCRKARRHGFRIWADLDLSREIGHIGSKTFMLPTS